MAKTKIKRNQFDKRPAFSGKNMSKEQRAKVEAEIARRQKDPAFQRDMILASMAPMIRIHADRTGSSLGEAALDLAKDETLAVTLVRMLTKMEKEAKAHPEMLKNFKVFDVEEEKMREYYSQCKENLQKLESKRGK